jgi:hypothetical protein
LVWWGKMPWVGTGCSKSRTAGLFLLFMVG